MEWRIESRQKSVVGVGGHNYLALVGPDGVVREEIHGTLGPNRRLIYAPNIPEPEVAAAGRPVLAGAPDQVGPVWTEMMDHAKPLDGKAVYGLLSPNSNAFWATVLRESGFDYRQHKPNSDLPTPGIDADLSDPLWWTPEHRWPGVAAPAASDASDATPVYRLP